jgi:hypothetical protein
MEVVGLRIAEGSEDDDGVDERCMYSSVAIPAAYPTHWADLRFPEGLFPMYLC